MTKTNKAIVSFANSRNNYAQGLARLSDSLRDTSEGIDFIGFIGEGSLNCPDHLESNYAFKIYALEKAIEHGYTDLLWLDCSVYAIASVQPIFDLIDKDGYFFQDSGWTCDQWTNQRTLDYFGTDGVGMTMFSSGITGVKINTTIGHRFFKSWQMAMRDGIFNGSWKNHRHDQSAGSLVAHQLGMYIHPCNEYYSYKCENLPITDKTVFLLEGM